MASALGCVTWTRARSTHNSGSSLPCRAHITVLTTTHLLRWNFGLRRPKPRSSRASSVARVRSSWKEVKTLRSPHINVTSAPPPPRSLSTRFLTLTLMSPRDSRALPTHPRGPPPPLSVSLSSFSSAPSPLRAGSSPSFPAAPSDPPSPPFRFRSTRTSTVSRQTSTSPVESAVHGMVSESSLAKARLTAILPEELVVVVDSPPSPSAARLSSRLCSTTAPFVSRTLRSSPWPSVRLTNFFSSRVATAVSTVSILTVCTYLYFDTDSRTRTTRWFYFHPFHNLVSSWILVSWSYNNHDG